MKLLLFLILIILINLSKSQKQCFNSLIGATTEFESSGINNNQRDISNGNIFGLSSMSNGTASIDLVKGMLYIDSSDLISQNFGFDYSTTQIWGFEENSTMYIFEGNECYTSTLNFPIPINQIPQLTQIGEVSIGSIDCINYEVSSPMSESYTTITVTINPNDCSLVSAKTTNTENYSIGGKLISFFNFIPKPNEESFILPIQCINANPLHNSLKLNNIISHSLSLLNVLI